MEPLFWIEGDCARNRLTRGEFYHVKYGLGPYRNALDFYRVIGLIRVTAVRLSEHSGDFQGEIYATDDAFLVDQLRHLAYYEGKIPYYSKYRASDFLDPTVAAMEHVPFEELPLFMGYAYVSRNLSRMFE